MTFWKLIDHSYVQSPFSAITKHIDNCILEDTLQFYILRTWINMRTKSFIKTSVTSLKRKSIKVPGKRRAAQKSMRALGRTLHQNRNQVSLILCAFFLSNLAFRSNTVLNGIFQTISTTIYLLFCLLINIRYITDLEVYLGLLRFFIRTSKIFMRLGVLFLPSKGSYYVLIFHEKCLPKQTEKIILDVNNCL